MISEKNMNKYLAVGVNKVDKVWHGHFWISPYFQIYNREGEMIEKRINPHGAGHGHRDDQVDNQPFLIKDILHDCTIFIGKKMGKASKQKLAQKLGIEAILTEATDPNEVVKNILTK